ncbi:MAG: hypothetical protein RIC14_05440 [Filomicrobium sp.]
MIAHRQKMAAKVTGEEPPKDVLKSRLRSRPMPGSRASPYKKKFGGKTVLR